MKISLITPAYKQSRAGNRTTAVRWARLLRRLGHCVRIAVHYVDEDADLMIALHAWRSAASIERFHARFPERPLIVALGGTDIYRFIHSDPKLTLKSLELADILVGLHERVHEALPTPLHPKLRVIYQSAQPLPRRLTPSTRYFDVCVIGHLREEKDPLRAALAARQLPLTSKIRITHLGRAHDAQWAEAARTEMRGNPRYRWLGEVPGWQVRRFLAKTHAMVLSSRLEGGANVVSEAVVANVPVLASDIPGSVGLLGRNYRGYYPVEDTTALARLLRRVEENPDFLNALLTQCSHRAALFRPSGKRPHGRTCLLTG
jgi:Glycosyltransferase